MSNVPPPPGQPPVNQPPGGSFPPPPSSPPPGGSYPTPPASLVASTWQGPPLASWGKRVGATLIDSFLPFIPALLVGIAFPRLAMLLYLPAIAWTFYNVYQGGEIGQTLGKKQLGIVLVKETDGQFIGGWMGIARNFLHIVDALPCYIGYLFPLWDPKKQTLTDKIMGTVVIEKQ